ncbi:MAG: 16S rRNA (cytosine(1402)-N(4))-methyltransferase RsmH [Bacilli bacterium]|nr:16S rRNA (cytosine(1402)-N(4))-methyltransferase RsmH [Bacilli bacterium]
MSGHVSVLLQEAIDFLNIKKDGTYVDCTLGRAGHSSEILKRIPEGRLIAFDQDEEAIEASRERLQEIGDNFLILKDNFANLSANLDALGIQKVDGILYDLGVSSPQFDEPERGFSYRADGPLDMRMDEENPLTAYEVVNTYSEEKLARILFEFGEEKDARKIAKAIVQARDISSIQTTFQLVEIIKKAKPRKELLKKGHPAKQAFQAIRMEVNHEEEALQKALEEAPFRLKSGGRMVLISFMSLDDRLIKRRFHELCIQEGSREGYLRPEEIQEPDFLLLTKKPILPSEKELQENRRAASAKLRAIERR